MSKELKNLQKLVQKKYRIESDLFFIEGKKIFQELLNEKIPIENVFVTSEFYNENKTLFKNIEPKTLKNNEFEKLSLLQTPQGIIAYVKKDYVLKNKANESNILFLNKISDPGNLGTIIRIADWFGFKEVVISEDSVELFNPKVVQATMGSIFHLKFLINVKSIEFIKEFKHNGYNIILADLDGSNLYQERFEKDKNIIIFSNEANGPEKEIVKLADKVITIPKFGKAESLNVAVSTGIILSHFVNNKR
ncbi:MAG TPA: RNA methyltransferase [Ignavibacteriales bacterium]|nr:RNA methyltransferase [Ignavibacteriales bacterium]HPD67988.1 RNA methyltransferase [Ignavibacteriales bacterium]HRR18012.1 RNA methyltransferase [Ignavibacteriales bacterium]